MSLTLTAATARLARELQASETAIAEALVATSALIHSAALASRQFPEASDARAQSALLNLNKTLSGLIEAQIGSKRAHAQLHDIGREMGATEIPFCPEANGALSDQQAA